MRLIITYSILVSSNNETLLTTTTMINEISNYSEQINAIAAFIRSNNIILTDENADQVMKDFMSASMKLNQNVKTLSARQAMIATGI